MKIDQVAAQLYTLREHLKTPADIAKSLRRVAEIGYPAVQVSAMGPIPEADLAKMCEDEGLVICATHEPSDVILNEPKKVVERLKKLGCKHTAYPYPKDIDFSSRGSVNDLIRKLNEAGRILSENELTLSYHNHAIEFRHLEGEVILEMIYENTDPEFLMAEIDTYWVQMGGSDPVSWCQSLEGRLPCVHLKDFMVGDDNQPTFAEIGNGNLDFESIVEACDDSGTDWFIVEQDTTPGDPFESLKESLEFIKENLVD